MYYRKGEFVTDGRIYLDEDLYLDFNRPSLVRRGLPIPLSMIEFLILKCPAGNLNHPVDSTRLIRTVWGLMVERPELHVYIGRIRDKLEPNKKKPKYLLTIRGFGYLLYSYYQ